MATYTLFYGTFVHLPRATPSTTKHELSIHHGALWVSVQDGRIKGFDWSVASEDDLVALMRKRGWSVDGVSGTQVNLVRAREDQNEFFFPGFVDTHIHAPQYPNSGVFGSSTLLDWLNTYTFPLEASFGGASEVAPPRAHAAYKQVVQRTLANGTTCASYFATIHVPATNLLATLCHQLGQRALVGRVCMDHPAFCPDYYHDEDAAATITATEATIAHIQGLPDPDRSTSTPLVQPIITPRFAPTCTPQSMTGLGRLAQSHSPPLHIQTHISENTNEVALVRELFPAHESYAFVYDAHALLTPRTILAHAVHLTPAEMALVRTRGAKIAHCPASNSALGSGICPVRTLLDRGITVGLGTDVSGGYSVSVLEAVRSACLVSRLLPHVSSSSSSSETDADTDKSDVLTVEDALYLGTRGGAAVVDMADEIGGFDEGMFFDAQLVRLGEDVEPSSSSSSSVSSLTCKSKTPSLSLSKDKGPVDIFGWEGPVERVHKWVWNGDDRNVSSVWVRGRMVHSRESETDRGAVCTVDGRAGKWADWLLGGLGVLGIVGVFWARRG